MSSQWRHPFWVLTQENSQTNTSTLTCLPKQEELFLKLLLFIRALTLEKNARNEGSLTWKQREKDMRSLMSGTWRKNSTQDELITIMIRIPLRAVTQLRVMTISLTMKCLEFYLHIFEASPRRARRVFWMRWRRGRKINWESLRNKRKKIEACKSLLWKRYLPLKIHLTTDSDLISLRSTQLMHGPRPPHEMTTRSQWSRKILSKLYSQSSSLQRRKEWDLRFYQPLQPHQGKQTLLKSSSQKS